MKQKIASHKYKHRRYGEVKGDATRSRKLNLPWCRKPEITGQMKRMNFFARQGADPQPYGVYDKGVQRRMAEKYAISFFVISGLRH